MKKLLFFTILLTASLYSLTAQSKKEIQFGIVVPKGDFADDDIDYRENISYYGSGAAGTGIHLNYKMINPLDSEGLNWTLNVGIMYNNLLYDVRDEIEDKDINYDFKFPKYLNIPILAGLQYESKLSENEQLFFEGALGLNILKMTKYKKERENYEITFDYKPSTSLGYKIGAGILFNKKYTISMNYMLLGSHKVKYDIDEEYSNGHTETDDGKFVKALPVKTLNITFGIRLK